MKCSLENEKFSCAEKHVGSSRWNVQHGIFLSMRYIIACFYANENDTLEGVYYRTQLEQLFEPYFFYPHPRT